MTPKDNNTKKPELSKEQRDRITEVNKKIKTHKEMLLDPECKFEEQTWIELQLLEFRKEIRAIKKGQL